MGYTKIGNRHFDISTVKCIEIFESFAYGVEGHDDKNSIYHDRPEHYEDEIFEGQKKMFEVSVYVEGVEHIGETEMFGLTSEEVDNVKTTFQKEGDFFIIGDCIINSKLVSSPTFKVDESLEDGCVEIRVNFGELKHYKNKHKDGYFTCGWELPISEIDRIKEELFRGEFIEVGKLILPINMITYIHTHQNTPDEIYSNFDKIRDDTGEQRRRGIYVPKIRTVAGDNSRFEEFSVVRHIKSLTGEINFSDEQKAKWLQHFVKVGNYFINPSAKPIIIQNKRNGYFSFRFRGGYTETVQGENLLEKEAKVLFEKLGIEYEL